MLDRTADTRIGTVMINKDARDHHFLSMQLESDAPVVQPIKQTNSQIGIDLNTDNFLTDSNGHIVANPRYYRIIRQACQTPA